MGTDISPAYAGDSRSWRAPGARVRLSCRDQPADRHRTTCSRSELGADAAWQRSGPALALKGDVAPRSLVKTGRAGTLASQVTWDLTAGQQVVLADLSTALPTNTSHPRGFGVKGQPAGSVARNSAAAQARTAPATRAANPRVERLNGHRPCLDPAQRATPAKSLPEWAAASVLHGSRRAPPS